MNAGPPGEGSHSILRTNRLELIPTPPAFVEAALAGDSAAGGAILSVRVAPDGWLMDPAVRAGWPIQMIEDRRRDQTILPREGRQGTPHADWEIDVAEGESPPLPDPAPVVRQLTDALPHRPEP